MILQNCCGCWILRTCWQHQHCPWWCGCLAAGQARQNCSVVKEKQRSYSTHSKRLSGITVQYFNSKGRKTWGDILNLILHITQSRFIRAFKLNRLKSCYQKRKNHYKKWKSGKGQAKGWNRDWSQWVIQGMYKNHWRKKCVKGTAVQK